MYEKREDFDGDEEIRPVSPVKGKSKVMITSGAKGKIQHKD